jgi:hypothetical protein
MASLSERLKTLVRETDIEENPLLVADGARLLSEVQSWEATGKALEKRVTGLERSGGIPDAVDSARSLADRAFEVLRNEGQAMRYREIAAVIKSRGFRHSREPKNPEKQLADSVWTAMYEDDRFTKVGRGVFDLNERL